MTYSRSALFAALSFSVVLSPALAQGPHVPPSNTQLASRQIERKVDTLLKQMTLDEKIGQLVQYSATEAHPAPTTGNTTTALNVNPTAPGGVDSYVLAQKGELGSMLNTVGQGLTNHFQHAAVDNTRLHIPLLFGADVIHGFRTIFPVPLATASSWDPALVTDLARDARWGRCTEGAGEDPYLGSAIARAYIRGYQGDSLSAPDSVAASVKHFAAYGAAEAGREYNTTDMSERELRQVYLPPYHAAVEAGAATVMSAFNSLNGVPASANPFLLQTILRQEWGFGGTVVSDYQAIQELIAFGFAANGQDAARLALTAGVTIEMGVQVPSQYATYPAFGPALVQSGKV